MQPKLLTAFVLAALASMPLGAAAADKGGGGGHSGPGMSDSPSGMRSEAPKAPGGSAPATKADQSAPKGEGAFNFNRLDQNRDGVISSEEAKAGNLSASRIKELDKDGDGKISREEAGGQLPGTPGGVSDTKR